MMIAFRLYAFKGNESNKEDIEYMRHKRLQECLSNIIENIEEIYLSKKI